MRLGGQGREGRFFMGKGLPSTSLFSVLGPAKKKKKKSQLCDNTVQTLLAKYFSVYGAS